MATVAQSRRKNLWFGTENWMQFVPTPNRGADTSGSGWAAGGDLLNGGGHQLNSFGSGMQYIFEWPNSSSREAAQLMKSYADGVYGRGLIYFVDPLIYDQNVFPAMWAAPSTGIGEEGASLVYGLTPTALPTSGWIDNLLPVTSAYYDLTATASGWRGKEDAIFIPVPTGYALNLGAFYTATGSAGVFYRTQNTSGGLGVATALTPLANNAAVVTNETISGPDLAGVWVYVGKSSSGSSFITLTAMIARLAPVTSPGHLPGPWIGGMGHSGCRFIGKPTKLNFSGANGGQVGYAASFREVGSWLYG